MLSIMEIYDGKYDYEDLKIAICVTDYINEWKIVTSYEEIVALVIKIKNEWKEEHKQGTLTEEEFAYIQKFARRYIEENKNKLMEELR